MTLYHYHGGTGTQRLGDIDDNWRFSNSVVRYSDAYNSSVDGTYNFDSGSEDVTVNYYYYDNQFTGIQIQSSTNNSYITGSFPFTWTGFNQAASVLNETGLDALLYSTDDIVDGSSEGGSLKAWTHAADDQVRLHTGTYNYVDAGDGNDYIQNWSWYADGEYLGGSGKDRFSVADGIVYGNSGADTFQIVPVYTDVNGVNGPGVGEGSLVYAYVMDFEVGVDNVAGSGLPIKYQVRSEGIWLGVENAEYSMLIKDVFDLNSLNFSAT